MDREFVALADDASDYLRAVLYELLVMVNRWYVARYPLQRAPTRHAAIERFVAFVDRTLSADLSIEDCARAAGVTSGHLRLLCRQQLGCSPIAYVQEQLMLQARRLLLFGNEPAAAIAYQLGFRDPAYFGRCFRKVTGESPRRFRLHRR